MSRNYSVYFELYNRKVKALILAESEDDARKKLLEKVIFHKIELDKTDEFNQSMDLLDNAMEAVKKGTFGKP